MGKHARRSDIANRTDVFVVYNPKGERHRSVLQITIRQGKDPSVEEHIAMQRLLYAVFELQQLSKHENV